MVWGPWASPEVFRDDATLRGRSWLEALRCASPIRRMATRLPCMLSEMAVLPPLSISTFVRRFAPSMAALRWGKR